MIKKTLSATLLCFCALATTAQVEQVQEKQAGISRRLQHEIEATKDPMLGYVPKSRLYQAYNERRQRINEMNALGRAPLFSWTERGPNADVVGGSNGNTRPGNGVSSGRVRALWEDLSNASRVWVGAADGGLWRTDNINSSPATWVPVNDYFGNLAVSSITQDPTDNNIIYFGTGEMSINIDAVRGGGVWRSVDGGATWAVMPGTETFYNISKIVCDAAGNLYVGNNSLSGSVGLQRYTKSTGTWAGITPSGLATRCTDVEISSTGRLHACFGYYNTSTASAGYRYTDNPATVSTTAGWTTPATTFPTQYRGEIAVVGSTLYAISVTSAYQGTLYKSTNGGANWATTSAQPTSGWANGQGWYSLSLGIDPLNANNVIVGGLDCYKSTNGGGGWSKISNWVGSTGQYVHADQHALLWNSSNRVIFGCDGGVFYSSNGGSTITDRNVGLRIKQFYSVAIHPTSTNYFIGGAQDNGTHQLNSAGLGNSVEVTGGDGAWTAIDQNQPQYQFGAYVYNQYRKSIDGGTTWTSANYSTSAGKFINPFIYDNTANILYACGNSNTYVRWSNPQTGSTFSAVSLTALSGGQATAFAVSPYSSNVVYMGGSGSTTTILRVSSANGTPAATNIIGTGMSVANQNVSSVQLGTSEQNIIVAMSNYGVNNVWVTTNGGTSWTAIDGNLPDMPVRWAMFYPGDNTKAIIATETGVWQTELINGTSTVWDPETGFPNVRTDMLQYRASDGLLAAATHGRGIYTTTIGAAPAPCNAPSGLSASSITNTSATVNWSAVSGAVSYKVEYKANSSSTWLVAASANTGTSQALSGLTQGTLYDYRVATNCASATSAATAAQFTTTVPASCGTPTGLASSAVSASGATVSWAAVSGASNYDVDYKLSSASTWTNAVTATTATSRSITGLSASSTYDYRVRANCSGASSAYASAQFTTSAATVTCPGTYDVSTNGTASGAATIPFNTDIKGLINTTTDNDYYKFVITTGGTATITLGTLPADFDIRLYSSNGTSQLAISQNGGTTSETISRTYTAGTYYVRVYGYNGANSTSTCYTLKVQLGTATIQQPIELVSSKGIEVHTFPNPAKDKLNISIVGDNTNRSLSMYDINGKLVYQQQVNDMITTLDISKLTKGIYFVKVTNVDGKLEYAEKVIKD
jgi:hypothetical protein